jgi:uncharacterized protein YjiS (DUF1127 family)
MELLAKTLSRTILIHFTEERKTVYPSIAFSVLYQTESQGQFARLLRPLPEHLLRDLGVSRGEFLRFINRPAIGSMIETPNGAASRTGSHSA